MLVAIRLFNLALKWATKSHICEKNLDKIGVYIPGTPPGTAGILLDIFNMFLSWITVLILPFQFIWMVVNLLREAFTPVPEPIKSLRWPLFNNPHMSPESVWAHYVALQARNGSMAISGFKLGEQLEIINNSHRLNPIEAIKILKGLQVFDVAVIESALEYFDCAAENPKTSAEVLFKSRSGLNEWA